jgi:hypothetical protein
VAEIDQLAIEAHAERHRLHDPNEWISDAKVG